MAVLLKTFDPPASSSSPGEAKISFALQFRATPAPRTQGPVERTDRGGGRDETAQPYFGCRKIAEQISSAFGIDLKKDVVRHILARHYPPSPDGGGPSWLAAIGSAKDCLWSVDLFRVESIPLKSYWILVVMDVYTRRIIGFGVDAANTARRFGMKELYENGCGIAALRASYRGLQNVIIIELPALVARTSAPAVDGEHLRHSVRCASITELGEVARTKVGHFVRFLVRPDAITIFHREMLRVAELRFLPSLCFIGCFGPSEGRVGLPCLR